MTETTYKATWQDALRAWRKQSGVGKNPKKGTPQYDEVAQIFRTLRPEWEPKPAPRTVRADKLARQLAELGVEVKREESKLEEKPKEEPKAKPSWLDAPLPLAEAERVLECLQGAGLDERTLMVVVRRLGI